MTATPTEYEPTGKVDKRKVTMRSVIPAGFDTKGKPVVHVHQAVDYVRPDFLDAYVEDARTRWQDVQVAEKPDAGPTGYHGQTWIPGWLDHPLAGQTFPATKEG